VTNAYTESANGLAKIVNRAGRGYGFGVIRARVLYGPDRSIRPSSSSASTAASASRLACWCLSLQGEGETVFFDA